MTALNVFPEKGRAASAPMLVQKEKPQEKGPGKEAKPPVKVEAREKQSHPDGEPPRRAHPELSRGEHRQVAERASKQGKEEQKTNGKKKMDFRNV